MAVNKTLTIRELEAQNAQEPNFGKGIQLAGGFDLGAKSPLDSRLIVKTLEERDLHVTSNRAYEGMLVYVDENKKTYQLVDNTWVEFGFNEEKFEAGIAPLIEKDNITDGRVSILENLVLGEEGEGLQSVIKDVAELQTNLATEVKDRQDADTAIVTKVDEVEAKVDLNTEAINKNSSDIAKEVSDRTAEISRVEGLVTVEKERAEASEAALSGRLDVVEGTEEGSIVKALADAKVYADTKVNEEKTRAEGVESELADKITTLENSSTDSNDLLDKAIKAESEARVASDLELDAKISKEVIDREVDCKNLDDKITAVDVKANAIETSLNEYKVANDSKVASVEASLAEHSTSNENSFKVVDEKIVALESEKDLAKSRLDSLEESATLLGGRLDIVEPKVETLEEEMNNVEAEIDLIKGLISDKNSNTLVFATMEEFLTATLEPKVGDLVFVVDIKKAYIYKGATQIATLEMPAPPQGWVLFDEITTEVDLVSYLKKSDAEATYRKLSVAIAEDDLEAELKNKINAKANASDVEESVNALNASIAEVDNKVSQEIEDRVAAVSALDEKVNSMAPVTGTVEPEGRPEGHIWVEII